MKALCFSLEQIESLKESLSKVEESLCKIQDLEEMNGLSCTTVVRAKAFFHIGKAKRIIEKSHSVKLYKKKETAPVIHARWLTGNHPFFNDWRTYCSNCGGTCPYDNHCYPDEDAVYCPWCGALMDEEENNE